MSALLQLIDVSFSRGSQPLFDALCLSINPGDRLGLTGHNGSGKSTLLSLITGAEYPDHGEVRMPRAQRVALVDQFVPEPLLEYSLHQLVLDALPIEEHAVQAYRVDALLQQLGFSAEQGEQPVGALSGGQQTLALLARAIVTAPDLLLMDEPGNHLDILAMTHLQRFLRSGEAPAYLLISHDRVLLNDCCERTVFLRDRQLHAFDMPFDAAAMALAGQDVQAAERRQAEGREIWRLQASATRLAQWGKVYDNEKLARKARTMQRRVERLQEEQTELSRGSGLVLQVNSDVMRARSALIIEALPVCTPDGRSKLLDIDYQRIRPGERIALLGKNGVGKSSMIARLLAGCEADDDAQVRFNPNVKLGCYDQELRGVTGAVGRFDWLCVRTECADEPIRQVLLQAGIAWPDMIQPVNELSGGEKARMMFMLFQLNRPNFLILDEPTNHIDIQGREQLEDQLIDSGATLLITSHDRRFVERVAQRWWWIDQGELHELNDLEEFYAAIEQDALGSGSVDKPGSTNSVGQSTGWASNSTVGEPDEGAVFDRIAELERLLIEDRARKPKFQKPSRHPLWEAEIARLWAIVDR